MGSGNYKIDEGLARRANDVNSYSDYTEGSATEDYNGYVARFKAAVEEVVGRLKSPLTAEQVELIGYWTDRYEKKLAEAINRSNRIEASCPSALVAGFSNFPTRKKERQNAARDKFFEECGELFTPETCYCFKKIEAKLTNKTIYSNDDAAVEKLQEKLQAERENHAEMVRRNAWYRKNGTMKGYEGLSDEKAAALDRSIKSAAIYSNIPYPPYELSNSSARIRTIKQRIEEIERMKVVAQQEAKDKYPEVEGVKVVENSELMRVQLLFDGKPEEAIRTILKEHGFKYAPSSSAWQRQLTPNGIRAAKEALRLIGQKKGGNT